MVSFIPNHKAISFSREEGRMRKKGARKLKKYQLSYWQAIFMYMYSPCVPSDL